MKIALVTNAAEAQKQLLATLENAKKAVMAGTEDATKSLKEALRNEVESAGLGSRLARTWQSEFYNNAGFNCAGFVYSKAPEVIYAFSEGATIKSDKGFWLAIPTKNAPKHGVDGKRISPSNFGGKLRFVYRPNGPSLLVVDNERASYAKGSKDLRGFRNASAKAIAAGQTATVVMFILLRQVTLKKRLSPDLIVQKIVEEIPGDILIHLNNPAQ